VHEGKACRFCTNLSGWTCHPFSVAAGTLTPHKKRLFFCVAFFNYSFFFSLVFIFILGCLTARNCAILFMGIRTTTLVLTP
jgi:hypothetical protein